MMFVLIRLAKRFKSIDNWIKKLIVNYSLSNPKEIHYANEYLPLHCQEELRQLKLDRTKYNIYKQPAR